MAKSAPEGPSIDYWTAMSKYSQRRAIASLLRLIEQNDTNYEKRTALVYEALSLAVRLGYDAGIRFDPGEGPGWPVVCIKLPQGEVSWHCKAHKHGYDGHSTEEKYRRVRPLRRRSQQT